jgi:3-hydroxyisobutyrate dehydrogenase-like beta-hydroxyacid dehydrogenase
MPKPIRHIGPIGLIGLGLMGNAIAARLLAAGFTVLGFDIAPKARAAFRKMGGQLVDHNQEIFARCDRVLLSLPDSKITRAVLREVTPALRYGHIIADTSTGNPQDAIAFSQQLASTGALYLDATISGNSDQVRRGEVVTMIGGSKHGFNQCAKTLRAFAKLAIHTGPVGSAAQMKLVTNLVLGLNRAALAEGLVFARTLGLDAKLTLAVLRSSMAYSRIMDVKGEKMISGDFKPQARLSQHLKDVRLMLASAKKSEVALPLSDTHRKILEAAEAAGYGQLDNSAIIRVIGAPFSQSARPKAIRRVRRNRPISPAQ